MLDFDFPLLAVEPQPILYAYEPLHSFSSFHLVALTRQTRFSDLIGRHEILTDLISAAQKDDY